MGTTPDVPPWRPIADWLCRLETGDHGSATTQEEKREYHETEAKAIAYDIATHGDSKAPMPGGYEITGTTEH